MKEVIFDLDGVVIDTERTVWNFYSVELLKPYGIKHREEAVRPLLLGSKFEDGTKIMHDFYGVPGDFESFLEARRELVRKGFAENVAFMEGFEDFYKRLAGRKVGVATSIDTEFLALTMSHLPLRSFFNEHIYTIAKVGGKGKPDPAFFLYAAGKMNVDPRNAVVIEDAPKGVTAANAAGMRSIAITTSVSSDLLKHANYVVDSFSEITDEMLA